MSEQALIVRNDAKLSIAFTEQAEKLKAEALESCVLIAKVTNADENALAVTAQASLQALLSTVEKARKVCKEPVLRYGKAIDDAAKKFVEELIAEMLRVSRLVGDFAQLEQAKARAAEQARNKALTELEIERAAATAKATSHDQLDAIAEHFSNKAAQVAEPPEPVRANGQRLVNDWEITVVDVHLLYRTNSTCVKLEPLMSEIKNLLKLGVTPKGVIAVPVVKAGVTRNAGQKVIEV